MARDSPTLPEHVLDHVEVPAHSLVKHSGGRIPEVDRRAVGDRAARESAILAEHRRLRREMTRRYCHSP